MITKEKYVDILLVEDDPDDAMLTLRALKQRDMGDRVAPVGAFADDFDVRLLVQQLANPFPRQRFVVHNQRSDFGAQQTA